MIHIFEALEKVKNALNTVPAEVFHYFAAKKPNRYIVWAEDDESTSLKGDNKKLVQVIRGTIDYFTKIEGDEAVEQIQRALDMAEIPYSLNSVQQEEETGFIHYEWLFEVI